MRSSSQTLTVADVTRAPYAGAAGSLEGAVALVRGVARAIEVEVESAVDEGVHLPLAYLLADALDCLDVLTGTEA